MGNYNKQCSVNSDCASNPPISTGFCSQGFCQEMQWCPAHSEQASTTVLHSLETAGDFTIWLKAAIAFPSLDAQRIFSTLDTVNPTPYNPSTYSGKLTSHSTGSSLGSGGSGGTAPPDLFTL